MHRRFYDIKACWNRVMAAAAFMLTALLNTAVAPQSEETRLANAPAKHLEIAAAISRQMLEPLAPRLNGGGDGGNGLHAAITEPSVLSFARLETTTNTCRSDAASLGGKASRRSDPRTTFDLKPRPDASSQASGCVRRAITSDRRLFKCSSFPASRRR